MLSAFLRKWELLQSMPYFTELVKPIDIIFTHKIHNKPSFKMVPIFLIYMKRYCCNKLFNSGEKVIHRLEMLCANDTPENINFILPGIFLLFYRMYIEPIYR